MNAKTDSRETMLYRDEIRALAKARPRDRPAEFGWWGFAAVLLLPWIVYDFNFAEVLSERRLANASRFLGEIIPYPIQQQGFSIAAAANWFAELWVDKGWLAVQYSFAISIVAIVLASSGAVVFSLAASLRLQLEERRELGLAQPLLNRIAVATARILALFFRAIPEYVWTFIFVMLLGVSAWPAILALALHNCGILTKLYSETIDDLPEAPLRSLRLLGARPLQVGILAGLPMALNRFLLYFFVRWETCVRESTVIGFLGIVSLGYWVEDARARTFYDQMFFFVVLGSFVVFLGDIVSTLSRHYLRKS